MASIGTNEFVTFTAGRMNKSVDERILPEGEYIDALNIRIGSTESSSAGAIENSLGNTKLTNITFNGDPLSVDAECIGAYEDGANETIYWFITDPDNVDMILSYNVRTQTLRYHVISVSVLNFDKQYRINSINLIDDLLFWTDNLNPPRKININRAYPYPSPTDNITAEDLNVIVAPPSAAPSIQLLNIAGEENYISDKFISFAYRYKYLDGEYSALSKFADIAFEPGVFSIDYSTYTNKAMENIFNTVKVSFDTGGDNVIGVDVCFKFSDSSVVNVIEKYNKSLQGWADNSTQEILFTNKKIYTALQESELLRLYDNVPRIAKTQTTMGNRLFYGNYVDGYDVVDENGDQINIDYTVNGVSEDIAPEVLDVVEVSGQDYTIDPLAVTSIADSGIEIDLTDVELKEGYTLVIAFNLIHNSFSGSVLYPTDAPLNQFQETFYFTFPRDYASVFDLGTDQAFIDAVYNHQPIADCNDGFSLTDLFNCSLVAKSTSGLVPAWDKTGSGISTNDGGFQIDVEAGSSILGIQVPAMEFSVEYPTSTMNYAYEYFENISTEAYLTLPKNNRSLHSNRDYELGIVYMDEYGRRSTALTCENNTVFFDANTSDQKNYINVSVNNIPPYWAKKYEFVLKPSKGGYQTIFSNIFFIDDDGYTWFKLEGDNRSKVQENQNLIVKRDSSGVVNSLVKTKVLAIEAKSSNFIDDATVEPAGTYMKLKASNFDAIFEENSFIEVKIKNSVPRFNNYPISDTPLYEDNPNYDSGSPVTSTNTPYLPIAIPAGTLVHVVIRMSRNSGVSGGCGSRYYRYDKSYVANEDYDSFYDFVEGQNISFTTGDTSGGDDTVNENVQYHDLVDYVPATPSSGTVPAIQGVNQYQFAEGYIDDDPMQPKDGRLYLVIRSGTPGCDDKGSYLSGVIEIQQATSTFIFETEPLEANGETFYEDGQVFDIIDGYHQGNLTDQTSVFDSATSNLDFFNCFSFGNGCESYKIGDSLIGAPFYLGTRVTAVSQEDYKEAHRYASITYSGIYNEETNINKLNEFNLALANYKDLEKVFGPIEVLYGRKTDLLVLQEDKISYVLQGKNLLSDAAGGGAISSIPEILGTQISRIEDNGISNNPESFTVYGPEVFFTDAKRSAVLNLRGGSYNSDNLVNISNQGMQYWFRDEFKNSLYNVKLGGYDPYMNEYVLSIKDDLLPIPETEIPCGVNTSFYNSSEPISYGIDFGKMTGDAILLFDVTEGDIDVIVTYNGAEVANLNINKPDSIVVSKDDINEQIVYVEITPNDATFYLDSDCIENDEVTVFNIVLNSPASEGQTIHTKYRWTSGSTVSPYDTKFITMSGTGVSLNESITGMISDGLIPAEGADISLVSQKVTGDTYDFVISSNKFKYLSSNTLYDVPTLIPLLNTITPTLNPSTGVYQGDINAFSYIGQYLYLVWDLRISESVFLCYDTTSTYDICCNCLTPSEYFMDAADFSSATALYTNASLSTPAANGYYGIDGVYRRLLGGVLLDPVACETCDPCMPWTGGTFKGEGGVTATFEYIDCETKEVMNADVSIPVNADPNVAMAYTFSPSICAVENSVQLISPSIPYITYEYSGSCAEDFCNNITIEVLVPENLTFNITPCGGSPENVTLNDESYNVCVQSINSIPPGTGTKFNIYLESPC